MTRQIKQGEGWRIGWDAAALEFCGLVGGEDWALELTDAEMRDFERLALELADTMQAMTAELMAEEQICCEVESDRLWLEAEGFPQAYGLRLLVLTGRRGEGAWAAAAVPGLMQALRTLTLF
ncbi:MAG: DUF1818 family protein [Kaiparowitsia implicata GSE-PSE-MK54-09C]|jgi:hypothetical protein|nr:DUF1818 family protein [Kaiparowitsia implicata GSE-PSE-MK54-09C]